jgi:hypothetical protein
MSGINKPNQRQGTRKKAKYALYESRGMREINKVKKIVRHLKKHDDPQSEKALKSLVHDHPSLRKLVPVGMR